MSVSFGPNTFSAPTQAGAVRFSGLFDGLRHRGKADPTTPEGASDTVFITAGPAGPDDIKTELERILALLPEGKTALRTIPQDGIHFFFCKLNKDYGYDLLVFNNRPDGTGTPSYTFDSQGNITGGSIRYRDGFADKFPFQDSTYNELKDYLSQITRETVEAYLN